MGTHVTYGQSLFYGSSLKQIVLEYLALLPDDIDTLVSRGSSGCAICTAMLLCSERQLYHVSYRKEGEDSHSGLGYSGGFGRHEIAIVDDFISTGQTVKFLVDKLTGENRKVGAIVVNRFQNPAGGEYVAGLVRAGTRIFFTNPIDNISDLFTGKGSSI